MNATAKRLRERSKASINEVKVQPLLTPSEVARMLGVSEDWLERDRATKRLIAYVKLSNNIVRYELAAVEQFIHLHRRGGAGSPTPPS